MITGGKNSSDELKNGFFINPTIFDQVTTDSVDLSLPFNLSLCPLRLDSTSFNFEIIS